MAVTLFSPRVIFTENFNFWKDSNLFFSILILLELTCSFKVPRYMLPFFFFF